jgi:hypothetical protein
VRRGTFGDHLRLARLEHPGVVIRRPRRRVAFQADPRTRAWAEDDHDLDGVPRVAPLETIEMHLVA